MTETGRKDKSPKEPKKKPKLNPKEKRKLKREKKQTKQKRYLFSLTPKAQLKSVPKLAA